MKRLLPNVEFSNSAYCIHCKCIVLIAVDLPFRSNGRVNQCVAAKWLLKEMFVRNATNTYGIDLVIVPFSAFRITRPGKVAYRRPQAGLRHSHPPGVSLVGLTFTFRSTCLNFQFGVSFDCMN